MVGGLLGADQVPLPGIGLDNSPLLLLGYVAGSLILGLLFAWACARIAEDKGYSWLLFAILGFVFSCATLVIALVLPRRNST